MLYSPSHSKSPQFKSKSKSFIQKKAKQPEFVWNIQKLGETTDADFDALQPESAAHRGEDDDPRFLRGSSGAQKVYEAQSCERLLKI